MKAVKHLTKLKKIEFAYWGKYTVAICLPSVEEVSFFEDGCDRPNKLDFLKQFLDLNRQIRSVRLYLAFIHQFDFSQYENIKVVKYYD